MSNQETVQCPECTEPLSVDRRHFMRVAGSGAVLLAGGVAPEFARGQAPAQNPVPAQPAQPKPPRPAEALIRELHAALTDEQKQRVVMPWNNPNRQRMHNAPINARISQVYTRGQQELIQRIMRAISSGDEGYNRLARGGDWDNGGGFGGCGANFFGSFEQGQPWAWVFSGHHLTARCDGDSEPDTAFGGPIFYGHSPDGHSQRNIFNYQTRAVIGVFNALSEAQRTQALVTGPSPGEGERSVQFRREYPGLVTNDLTLDQLRLVETVMRELLSPYRREDADEVMQIVRRNGGLQRLHLAFYRDRNANEQTRWNYWRLEGPGFVWNYRVLPHVHCYVNIAARRAES